MLTVTPIAWTSIDYKKIGSLVSGTAFADAVVNEWETPEMEHLIEFAGRTCYLAYERLNEKTNTPESYIGHLIDQGHFSVLEHATVTFHVKGASRSMLLELERHRFLSFSVESQRYVDQTRHEDPVVPPAIEAAKDEWLKADLQGHYRTSLYWYRDVVETLTKEGVDRKTARGAARAFLPESTETTFVVTGNLRCWRDVLGKRYHEAADAEIREFATLVLNELRQLAPAAVQDIEEVGRYA